MSEENAAYLDHPTLLQVIETFLTGKRNFTDPFRPNTVRNYRSDLQSIATELDQKGKSLLDATTEEVLAVLPSNDTTDAQRRATSAVRSFFKFCRRNEIKHNATIPAVQKRPYTSLYTPQQHIDDVLARISPDGATSLRDTAILCLTYGMGMKPGELLTLTGQQLGPIKTPRTVSLNGTWLLYNYFASGTLTNPNPEPRIIPVQPTYAKGYEDFIATIRVPNDRLFCTSEGDRKPFRGTKGLQRIIDKYVQTDSKKWKTDDNSKTLRNGYVVLLKEADATYQDISQATGLTEESAIFALNKKYRSTARTE